MHPETYALGPLLAQLKGFEGVHLDLNARIFKAEVSASPTQTLNSKPLNAKTPNLGPGVGPYFLFSGLGFPCNPLKNQKG